MAGCNHIIFTTFTGLLLSNVGVTVSAGVYPARTGLNAKVNTSAISTHNA